jgi:hypothetical protein
VNKRFWIVGIFCLVALCLWLGSRSDGSLWQGMTSAGSGSWDPRHGTSDRVEGAGPCRTKASDRPGGVAHQTHGPERLREFMLPAMVIEDLSLEDALQKLTAAYVDACRMSDEVPLPLTFSIAPPGSAKKLKIHLPAENFSSSVRLLASLAGMKASRDGREFRFESLPRNTKLVKRNLQVPPNFSQALSEMAGETNQNPDNPFEPTAPITYKRVQDLLNALGLDLDPSTKLALRSNGNLAMETSSAADAFAIAEISKIFVEQRPTQLKFTPQVVEISADSNWVPPDVSRMTDNEFQMLMGELSRIKGTDLQTLPSVTCKNGQNATLEIIQEVSYPTDDSGNVMETRNTGKEMKLTGTYLGFGQEVAVNFTDTRVDYDTSSGKPTFTERTAMNETGYTSDGGTRFIVQIRPDGSRTVVLLTATMIDATGRPVH